MKRHVIVILLTLALLGVLAFSVSAAPSTDPAELNKVNEAAVQMTFPTDGSKIRLTCPYCNENSLWLPLPAATSAKGLSGHYYLSGDMTSNTSYYIPYDNNVCLNLNGHSIKTTNAYAIAGKVGYEFNVMGNGYVEGAGSNANGTVFGQGTIRLFGGTYTATNNYYVITASADNANVYMFDGAIVNGKQSATSAIVSTKPVNFYLYGGTVNVNKGTGFYLTKGTLYLSGVTVNATGGRGVYLPSGTATVYQTAGSITGASKCNVRIEGGTGTYTLSGGSISGGSGAYLGSNVRVQAGQFIMTGGSVTGGSTTAAGGGNVCVEGTGVFNMTGGEISGGSAGLGGNVYLNSADATFTLDPNADSKVKAMISGGAATTAGGSIYVKTGTLAVNAGTISGGTAPEGGSVYIDTGAVTLGGGMISNGEATTAGGSIYVNTGSLTINSGSITGGTAPNGGSVYNAAGTVTVAGGTISGGEATTAGGSVYIYSGELNVNGGTITGGKAPNGGNIYLYAGDLTLDGGTITKGTANRDISATQWYYYGGGNIYVGDSAAAEAYIVSGTVSDGTSTNNGGGNILCRGNGTLTVSGGTIFGGKSGYPGANIMNAASKNVTISGGTISGGNGNTRNRLDWDGDNVCAFGGTTTVSGGTIESDGKLQGNGVLAFYNAKIVLDGDATITTTGNAGNIYIAKQSGTATLQVNSTFTGEAGVSFDAEHGAALGAILTLDSSTGAYTGTLYLEDLGNPTIFGTTDNKLQVAGVKLNDTWYQNNDTAVAAAGANDVITLQTADELKLQGADYVVDLNGQSPTITGTGSVTCFDSANLDFVTFGTATVNGPTLVNTESTARNGVRYYTLKDGNSYSFHILEANVSSVSVRPGSAGVYYSCTWNCDSTLLELLDVDSYGVALSLVEMPTENFTSESHTLYTKVNGVFEPGVKRNSVLVDKILKTGNTENQERAAMEIFAIPYVVVNGEAYVGTGVQYSFKDIVGLMDQEKIYFANREALENFYSTWESVMKEWDRSFIGQYPMDPSEDGVLRFFLMGNSFTYYYVEELYTLLAEAGYENAEIYNLYHSGSGVLDHVTWWENNEAEYEFYLTTRGEDGKYKRAYVNPDKKWWTLDEALVTANWDYIGIQPTTTGLNIGVKSAIGKTDAEMEEHLANAIPYFEKLLNHLYGYFPNATFMWQRSWASEIGRVSGSTVYDEEYQKEYSLGMQRIQDYMTNVWDLDKPYDLIQVNCGAAWDEARALNDALETKLIPEVGGLCARLGVVNTGTYPPGEGYTNPGDGYHEGDIGGGQLLNAYVWFMTIMQTLDPDYIPDVSESQYVPDYTRGNVLKTEFVELLKNAAMSVFETAE